MVVSTVPAAAQTAGLLAACAEVAGVFEVVYDPWPTPLAAPRWSGGGRLVSGLDLLAHQAVLQVELMTGDRCRSTWSATRAVPSWRAGLCERRWRR